jgi:guanylate kinase
MTETKPVKKIVVVISGPSGAGKDSIIERLPQAGLECLPAVTATTRTKRPNEKEGINHHFRSKKQFIKMQNEGELLEWAKVYDKLYGTPKSEVENAQKKGLHPVVRVDVQGARQLRLLSPDALLIFVKPPSIESLRKRLKKRNSNLPKDIERRLSAAKDEIRDARWFDYCITNEDGYLMATAAQTAQIVQFEQMLRETEKQLRLQKHNC